MSYNLDLGPIQADITDWFETTYPGTRIVVDGLLDDDTVPKFANGTIKPFIILNFGGLRRAPRGRSYGGTRMDSYRSGFDVFVVASNPSDSRSVMNTLSNALIGHKFENCGETVKGMNIFENAKNVLDATNKPSRWVVTERFDMGVFAQRSVP